MGKSSLVRKIAAWAVCALLACSMTPAIALAGVEDTADAGKRLAAASQSGQKAASVPKASIKDYTWGQLKKISNKIAAAKNRAEGLAIAKRYGLVNAKGKLTGATKSLKLTDGKKAKVRILGFRQDKLASGGVSGISFEFASIPAKHVLNKTDTNKGGWKRSGMRSWLNSSFAKSLPPVLRKRIAPAKKRTNNVGGVGYGNTSAVSATKDRLWLLSNTEVYGDCGYAVYNAEGNQYKLYSDKKVTMSDYSFCKKTGVDYCWWLRSPHADDYWYHFHSVESDGHWDNRFTSYAHGVSPGFCF